MGCVGSCGLGVKLRLSEKKIERGKVFVALESFLEEAMNELERLWVLDPGGPSRSR